MQKSQIGAQPQANKAKDHTDQATTLRSHRMYLTWAVRESQSIRLRSGLTLSKQSASKGQLAHDPRTALRSAHRMRLGPNAQTTVAPVGKSQK